MWIPYDKRPSFVVRPNKYTSEKEENMNNGGGGYLLQKASTDKVNNFNITLNSLEVGHSSMQGYRVSMEDACIAVIMDDLPDHVVVGILDGHAGKGASDYMSKRLSSVIAETTHFQEYMKLDKTKRSESINLLSVALVQAFVDMDDEFYNYEHMVCNAGTVLALCCLTFMKYLSDHLSPYRYACQVSY
jgi:hypothetical protein